MNLAGTKNYLADDMCVVHVKSPQGVDQKWYNALMDYCQREILNGQEPKWQNYTEKNLDIIGHEFFSLLLVKGQIAAFCGLYNGGRYAPWIFRANNRTYVDPKFRLKNLNINKGWMTPIITKTQINDWKVPKLIFISMQEARRSTRAMIRCLKSLEVVPHQNWIEAPGFVKVASGESRSCYQRVVYNDVSHLGLEFNLPMISDSDYDRLPQEVSL